MKAPLLTITFSVLALCTASAATINWGSGAVGVSDIDDISTNGTLVEAFNFGSENGALNSAYDFTVSVGDTDIGFVGSASESPLSNTINDEPDFFSGTTGDANYDSILSSLSFGGGSGLVNFSVGSGLVSGETYEIQLWFVDDRAASSGRVMEYGDGNGNTVSLSASGEYAIGTFTADGSSQTITLDAVNMGQAHLNAYQLRALAAIPEPSTWAAILGVLALGAAYARRRR